MLSTESVLESAADQSCIRLEPLVNTHLTGKTTTTGGSCDVFTDGSTKVRANGVHDIEDRILRITGYYGYNPGTPVIEVSSKKIKYTDGITIGCDDFTPFLDRCVN
ncbi:hypothetical protein NQZ68_020520 [Dissostichus eleginoides]|nr:hypothetical protein NQZ68_020520 [Dissostichus eleginoides]